MEARFMDTHFNTTRYVDAFSSFIWNDEYIGYGDFELSFPMEVGGLAGISDGYYVSIKESPRYMIVEGIDIQTDVENGNYAIISGRSLESILTRRIVRSKNIFSGSLEQVVLRLINANFTSPSESSRAIGQIGVKKTTDPTIKTITTAIEIEEGDNVYDTIMDICDYYKVGFRMMVEDDKTIVFELYNGVDRSYNQDTNPYVVFSTKFENLKSSDMQMNTENYKNVCYVVSEWTESVEQPVLNDNGNPVKVRDEETGMLITQYETVQVPKRLQKIVSFESPIPKGMDRREIFKRSNLRTDTIDKTQFGTPGDRVNRRDFESWEVVYFDHDKYQEDMDEFDQEFHSMLDERKKKRTETVWVGEDDPRWDPERAKYQPEGWAMAVTVEYPEESVKDWRERNKKAFDWASRNEPSRDNYYKYGWVLTDEAGYQNAIDAAQNQIDQEYAAAIAAEEARVLNEMASEGYIELAKYSDITAFEGEVDSNVNFLFGRDYGLGDIVQIVNQYDFQATTRVTGMMFSEEEGTGFVARPTFKSDNKAEVTI